MRGIAVLGLCVACETSVETPDRVVDAIVTFEGHDDLDGREIQSTTPAGNHYASAAPDGQWLMQLAFTSDEADPSTSASFSLSSPTGSIVPGTFPVMDTVQDDDDTATLIFLAASNSGSYSATGIGLSGTFELDVLDGGLASGSFDLTGTAAWTAGTGIGEYGLVGTFSDVPITDL